MYDGGDVVVIFDETGSFKNRYLHGDLTDQVFLEESVGEILWGLEDNQGTIRDVANYDPTLDTSATLNHRQFDAFGNITSESNGSVEFLFAHTGAYLDRDTGLQNHDDRWYDPLTGRWTSEDPDGFHGGDSNLNRYVGNGTPNFVDPSGNRRVSIFDLDGYDVPLNPIFDPEVFAMMAVMNRHRGGRTFQGDWLDISANYAAGVGDSLSFGITDGARNLLGINDGIDHNSTAYVAGEWTEISVEMAVTGGGAALRHGARRIAARGATQAMKNASRAAARRTLRNRGAAIVHHVNTLAGHPAIKGGRASRLSKFPTLGLPRALHNGRWNLRLVSKAKHAALHARAYRAELLVYYGAHPFLTAARAERNLGWHEPTDPPLLGQQ